MTTTKALRVEISRNTNPAVSGRYFVDVRCTSEGDRQVTTFIDDAQRVVTWIKTVTSADTDLIQPLTWTVVDTTGELEI